MDTIIVSNTVFVGWSWKFDSNWSLLCNYFKHNTFASYAYDNMSRTFRLILRAKTQLNLFVCSYFFFLWGFNSNNKMNYLEQDLLYETNKIDWVTCRSVVCLKLQTLCDHSGRNFSLHAYSSWNEGGCQKTEQVSHVFGHFLRPVGPTHIDLTCEENKSMRFNRPKSLNTCWDLRSLLTPTLIWNHFIICTNKQQTI